MDKPWQFVRRRISQHGGQPNVSVTPERYEIVRSIGQGGFGEVMEALDRITKEKVAIKRVQWSTLFNLRKDKVAKVELELLMSLKHPSIVSYKAAYFNAGVYSTDLMLVMELCVGDLNMLINDPSHVLSYWDIAHTMRQICSAVAYLHTQCIIHRDLKPQNVLISRKGQPKVTDFGLACICATNADTLNKMRRTMAGSPQYVAPELFTGTYNEQVDIWGLGCIFYELCVRETFQRYKWNIKLDTVDPTFRSLLEDMLNTNPDRRPRAARLVELFTHRHKVPWYRRASIWEFLLAFITIGFIIVLVVNIIPIVLQI